MRLQTKLDLVRDFLIIMRNRELMHPKDLQKDVIHLQQLIEYVTEAIETLKKG